MLCSKAFTLMAAVYVATVSLATGAETVSRPFGDNVRLRGNFDNARITFERTGKGTVAFLGGSITEMNGFRPMVCEILRKRFPKTTFTFIAAGIGSTCSTTGAFRLDADVLAQGPVDLLFVEFAVNDDQDGRHTRAECIRGMEGIVRHALKSNPKMDIAMIFFVNEYILKTLQDGKAPLTVEAHEAVAEHYRIPTINLAKEVAEEITAGTLTWQKYGGVHPAVTGNTIAADMIDQLFARAWTAPLTQEAMPVPNLLPSMTPLDPMSYVNGRFTDIKEAKIKQGWTLGVPDWASLPGDKRPQFTSVPMLCATVAGAEATLAFEGNAVGAYIVAGPDAGIVEASIDNEPFRPVNLYHPFSKGLHYPRTVMLGAELKPGPHTLTLRIAAETKSAGHAMRIMHFVAN